MDFELTDDQQELQQLVRDVAGRECPPSLVRAVADDAATGTNESGTAVADLWKTYVSLDWPSLTVPVDDGGMGLGAVELVLVAEELGRVADPTPYLATTTGYVPLVRAAADAGRRAELLGAVCAGRTGTVAFDAAGVRSEAVDGGRRIDGTLRFVVDGDRADVIAVPVEGAASGTEVLLVSGDEVDVERIPSFDASLHVAHLRLDGVVVAEERCLAGPGVSDAVARAHREAVTGLSASMVGASQTMFDMALEHLRTRHQFGQPIGAFQALKHMAVDVYVAIERARALCHFAALTLAEDDDRQVMAASMAKAAAGDCQRIASAHSVQFYGGLGYTWENDLHLFLRRAKSGELLLGTSGEHRRAVARQALDAALDAAGADGEVRS